MLHGIEDNVFFFFGQLPFMVMINVRLMVKLLLVLRLQCRHSRRGLMWCRCVMMMMRLSRWSAKASVPATATDKIQMLDIRLNGIYWWMAAECRIEWKVEMCIVIVKNQNTYKWNWFMHAHLFDAAVVDGVVDATAAAATAAATAAAVLIDDAVGSKPVPAAVLALVELPTPPAPPVMLPPLLPPPPLLCKWCWTKWLWCECSRLWWWWWWCVCGECWAAAAAAAVCIDDNGCDRDNPGRDNDDILSIIFGDRWTRCTCERDRERETRLAHGI